MMLLLSTLAYLGAAQRAAPTPGGCPYMMAQGAGPPMRPLDGEKNTQEVEEYLAAFHKIDFNEVKKDLAEAMLQSRDFWPADYDNYGPLWVRMAWHCAGSYRNSDGRGGCDGGQQVYDPERSWDDNTNLDKARRTVFPIKQKYGLGLSWGDLIILAGDVAVEQMGGPNLGTCLGRIDSKAGTQSEPLGFNGRPTYVPCETQGFCKAPAGSVQTGLIYVNPGGPGGNPDPAASARSIRDTFGRMSMNDTETVALVGGGHAFGKVHGACPNGPGQRPSENQTHPWVGTCGEPGTPTFGKRENAVTSGFEGPWTEDPTTFSNTYFQYLVQNKFEIYVGPGGNNQWRAVEGPKIPPAPSADLKGTQEITMLTSDVAFQYDPEEKYQGIIKEYFENMESLEVAFSNAWYKLTTRDMGPASRCLGPFTAPPQPFQAPLPPAPSADDYSNGLGGIFDQVSKIIDQLLEDPVSLAPQAKGLLSSNGRPNPGAHLIRYAFSCASSFRQSDYQGGCNGARIRFSPEKDFAVNHGLSTAEMLLAPIKEKFGDKISWADLIVLAGTKAITNAGGDPMAFCGGRVDADAGESLDLPTRMMLEPRITGEATDTARELKYQAELMGLTDEDIVALIGAARSLDAQIWAVDGFLTKTTDNGLVLDNKFFQVLFMNDWVEFTVPIHNVMQYANKCAFDMTCDTTYKIHKTDWLLAVDDTLAPIALLYAADDALFKRNVARAWTKLMNADRFDGPGRNLCNTRPDLVHGLDEVKESMKEKMEHLRDDMDGMGMGSGEGSGMEDYGGSSALGGEFVKFLQSVGIAEDSLERLGYLDRHDGLGDYRHVHASSPEREVVAETPSYTLLAGANTMAMIAGYVGLAAAAVAFGVGRFGKARPAIDYSVSEETPLRQ